MVRARAAGDTPPALVHFRAAQGLVAVEHIALVLAVATGLSLMWLRGWGLGHSRWLGIKVGLVAFLVLPLEGMHAYVCHVWIARGLRGTAAPPFSKELTRGVGMVEMIRTIELLLLVPAVPFLLWLSLARPF